MGKVKRIMNRRKWKGKAGKEKEDEKEEETKETEQLSDLCERQKEGK